MNSGKFLHFLWIWSDTNMYDYAYALAVVHSCCLNTDFDFPKQHWTSRGKRSQAMKGSFGKMWVNLITSFFFLFFPPSFFVKTVILNTLSRYNWIIVFNTGEQKSTTTTETKPSKLPTEQSCLAESLPQPHIPNRSPSPNLSQIWSAPWQPHLESRFSSLVLLFKLDSSNAFLKLLSKTKMWSSYLKPRDIYTNLLGTIRQIKT